MKKIKIIRVNAKTKEKEILEMEIPEGKTIQEIMAEIAKREKGKDN